MHDWLHALVPLLAFQVADAQQAAVPIVVAPGESVQAAIDAAPAGATITLAAGVFPEAVTITRPLNLQGAGWERTTLGPLVLDSPLPTVTVKGARDVVLSGLRLRGPPASCADGGLGTEALVTFDDAGGAVRDCAVVGPFMNGIRLLAGSDVRIERSLVAAMWNTGVVADAGARLHLVDSDVRNCYHRGVTLTTGDATIERCRISGSAWHGIRYDGCSPRILSNHVFGNARSGLYASGSTAALVRDNVFWRNEMNAISCWFDNRDLIEGNSIIGNLREGIAVLGASRPSLVRNVFVGNPIAVYCGTIAAPESPAAPATPGEPQVERNVFFDNPVPLQVRDASQPLPPGNESSDPQLGGAADAFRPAATSPARRLGAGATDPIDLASPFALQPEELAMVPDTDTRTWLLWKKASAPPASAPTPTKR
jgi:nitrous oxidase accessory protein